MYYYNTAGVLWYLYGGNLTNLQDQLANAVGANGPDEFVSGPQQSEMVKRSFAVLLSHPMRRRDDTALLCVLAIVPTVEISTPFWVQTAYQASSFWRQRTSGLRIQEMLHSPLLSVFVLIQIPLVVFTWIGVGISLIGIHQQPRSRIPMILAPLGVAMVMLLLATGPAAIARFRVPAMPFLAMLAGAGWSGLSWVRHRDSVQIAAATLACPARTISMLDSSVEGIFLCGLAFVVCFWFGAGR